MVGDFVALADVRQSVALDCADELLHHWIANALAREGYAVAADATIKITAKSSTEIIVDNIAVNSISALIRHLSAMA
jgi:hypothetical protein